MNIYVLYFFLIITAIWLYRLLAYFFNRDESKNTPKGYRTADRRRLNRY